MDKEYYTKYYLYERNHWWFKVRESILKEKINNLINTGNNIRILNVGVATGRTTEWLTQYGKVTSVEYDKDCCDFLKTQLNMEVINASVTNLPFEHNLFDMVCAFDVIEHVDDDQKAVNEMIRVCKENGTVFITVPAFMNLWSSHDDINHHKRRYAIHELKKLFKNKHGQITSTYFNTLLFLPIYLIRKILNLFADLRKDDKKQSDFALLDNKLTSSIFYRIFLLEKYLLRLIKFPFGISVLLTFKKNNACYKIK